MTEVIKKNGILYTIVTYAYDNILTYVYDENKDKIGSFENKADSVKDHINWVKRLIRTSEDF